VDDNESFLEAVRVLLEREGLSVAGVASTYADALDLIETLRPDVVLVDIFLGEESGLELARHLAEDGHGQSDAATVILISNHARPTSRNSSQQARRPASYPTWSCRRRRSAGSSTIVRVECASGRRDT
jgi:CheY-like chemotaxis protein